MVGRLLSFWEGLFLRAMLVLGRVGEVLFVEPRFLTLHIPPRSSSSRDAGRPVDGGFLPHKFDPRNQKGVANQRGRVKMMPISRS